MSHPFRPLRFAILLVVALLSACGSIMHKATQQFANNLTGAILDQDDPATVRDGVPAYLLLVDGLVRGDPEDADTLLAGAKLYGAYVSGFVGDASRVQLMSARAFDYARRALCLRDKQLCAALDQPFDIFATALGRSDKGQLATLYGFTSAWVGKIQANTSDWNAIADIPKVQALLERVVAIDPRYDDGGAWLYLGVLNSIRPASLGGKPELGKADFDKALEISGGNNQMVRVLYAQFYARLVFDQELHDKLLRAAIAADPHAPGLTLINVLAQRKAKALLESGKDYF